MSVAPLTPATRRDHDRLHDCQQLEPALPPAGSGLVAPMSERGEGIESTAPAAAPPGEGGRTTGRSEEIGTAPAGAPPGEGGRPAPVPDAAQRRAAVIGGAFGFFVDMFDVYLPTIALTPALPYFVPASVPAGAKELITAAVFVSTLIGRPLGSLIFGRPAYRVGRR